MVERGRQRLGLIGAGAVMSQHLPALDRLGRTALVGVVSRSPERANAAITGRGGVAFTSVERMLDETRPDVAFVGLPPHLAGAACQALIDRGIPFLVEKPIAADPETPQRLAQAIADAGLVVAVGYHLRGLDYLPQVRALLTSRPARLVVARWLGDTPPPAWWRRADQGGGQIVEQATHWFDLARHLVGEATVLSASASRGARTSAEDDVADLTVATLQFENGALGAFTATRLSPAGSVAMELIGDGVAVTFSVSGSWPDTIWSATIADGGTPRTLIPGRSPYEVQAEAFLDAVEARDPSHVLCSYADALRTDRLTRAVVAATGQPG